MPVKRIVGIERKLGKQETAFSTLAMAIIFPRYKSEYAAAFYKSSEFFRFITLQVKVDEYECEILDFQNACDTLQSVKVGSDRASKRLSHQGTTIFSDRTTARVLKAITKFLGEQRECFCCHFISLSQRSERIREKSFLLCWEFLFLEYLQHFPKF